MMIGRFLRLPAFAAVCRHLCMVLLVASSTEAADLTWDTVSGDGAAITHANGTWNLTHAFWNNGSGNIAWTNTTPRNSAVFAGNTSGTTTVTIGTDSLQVGRLTINGAGGTMVLNGTYANLNANLLEVKTCAAGKLAINASSTLANVAAMSIANGASVYITNATVNSAVSVSGQGNTENLGATSATARELLPSATEDNGGLVLQFRCLNAASRGNAAAFLDHGVNLGGWTSIPLPETTGSVAGVAFVVTPDGGFNQITATIPADQAAAGKLFARLRLLLVEP